METMTLGGQSFGSSFRRTASDHQELPIRMAVGGGQRKLVEKKRINI